MVASSQIRTYSLSMFFWSATDTKLEGNKYNHLKAR